MTIRTFGRGLLLAVVAGIGAIASAQGDRKSALPVSRSPVFEVVSIRSSSPNSGYGQVQILPDGYRVRGLGLWTTLSRAYFANLDLYSPDRFPGMPSWMNTERYDVDAKVSAADVPAWQNPAKQPAMLQAMLQAMLADRLKLVIHRSAAQVTGYELVVAKNGPKLKEMPAGEVLPAGYAKWDDGSVVVGYKPGEKRQLTFFATTMPGLAHHMSGMSFAHPVLDKTGLTGRYDFVLAYRSMDGSADDKYIVVLPGDADPLANWDVQALGLKLIPAKIPTETIVIDHIERPSAN